VNPGEKSVEMGGDTGSPVGSSHKSSLLSWRLSVKKYLLKIAF
jgi:hypothetical protein